jgi:hypothetical protein
MSFRSITKGFPQPTPAAIESRLSGSGLPAPTDANRSVTAGHSSLNSVQSAVKSDLSRSDGHAPTGPYGSVTQLLTPLKTLESALESYLEHSKLPEPTSQRASDVSFPDSLEPLQSTVESYLSRVGIPFPTSSLEPAIKHYFGPKRAPLPSPANAIKSFIASFVSSILSSREASTGSGSQATVSKVFTNLPPVSSLHFGKPVSDFHFIFGTIYFKLKSIP